MTNGLLYYSDENALFNFPVDFLTFTLNNYLHFCI